VLEGKDLRGNGLYVGEAKDLGEFGGWTEKRGSRPFAKNAQGEPKWKHIGVLRALQGKYSILFTINIYKSMDIMSIMNSNFEKM
jgi:hypothetical protein